MILDIIKAKYDIEHPRYKHIMGVTKLAIHLANKYGEDPSKAEIAALVHDYYRHEDIAFLRSMMDEEIISKFEKTPIIFHAYAAAKALKPIFGIDDENIYLAVQNHVHGRINMTKLEEIIMLADFAEENRTNPGSIQVRALIDKDYDKALYLSFSLPYDFLAKTRGVVFSEEQIAVKDYYHMRWIKNYVYGKLNDTKKILLNKIINNLHGNIEAIIVAIISIYPFTKEELTNYFLLDEKLYNAITDPNNSSLGQIVLQAKKEV